jgi:hypothetical protein
VPIVPALVARALAFFSLHLAEPDKAFFARRNPPAPETRSPRSSLALGVLELLAPCSGMSELLIPKRGVLSLTSGRFLANGSSLSLAEISTAGSLVAAGPLNGVPELPVPC